MLGRFYLYTGTGICFSVEGMVICSEDDVKTSGLVALFTNEHKEFLYCRKEDACKIDPSKKKKMEIEMSFFPFAS